MIKFSDDPPSGAGTITDAGRLVAKPRRDFESAMRTQLHTEMRRATPTAVAPLVLLPAGAGVGGLLRLLPRPPRGRAARRLPIALEAGAVVGAVLWLVVEYRVGPLKRVDWATAEQYERRLTAPLSLGVRAVLVGAQQTVRGRTRAAVGVHRTSCGPRPAIRRPAPSTPAAARARGSGYPRVRGEHCLRFGSGGV